MKPEIKIAVAILLLLISNGIALCQTNEVIKANNESYAQFTRLKEKYKYIPDVENLLLLNYEHLITETHQTEVDTKGNVIKEQTIRTIGGSIDKINYDSIQRTANVIVITPAYIKAIYFWEYTGRGWEPFNPKDRPTTGTSN